MTESSAGRLSRLLALVPWLLAHDGVTLGECARHFGVSESQLQEDLELLIVCGRPGYGPDQLVDIQFWDDDFEIRFDERIHVLDPQGLGLPLRLTHEEALTLLVALRLLAQVPGVEGRDAIVSAAVKLEEATRAADAARLVSVDTGVDDAVRQAVDTALAQGRALRIRYASGTRDDITERTVDPVAVQAIDGVAYLEAHCRLAGALRTFRLDRVLAAWPADPSEDPAADDAPGASNDDAPRAEEPRAPDRTAVLELQPSARWVIDVHGAAVVQQPSPDGAWTRVELPLHSEDWGVRLILSLGGQGRAVAPPSLVAAVARAAEAATAAYR